MKSSVLIVVLAFLFYGCFPGVPGIDFGPRIDLSPKFSSSSGRSGRQGQHYASQMSQVMFSYMFAPGGIWPWQKEFKEGEWSSWVVKSGSSDEEFNSEIAYLADDGEGRRWWRLTYRDGEEELVYEALIRQEDFSIRRMRAKINDDEPSEVPVTEGGYGPYGPPRRITPESLEAAVQETMTLRVPAGKVTAERAEYGGAAGGTVELWLNDRVPGGVVKYRFTSDDGEGVTGNLKDYGTGAKTILGSY
ncbi:MAG: hypothetical protein U9R36_06170 [Elusimicrobiota bacterium]|nr:hypothetical protein [Elusimicrobiota bacterium]